MQFSTKAAPAKFQVGGRDSEILSGTDFHSNTRERELQKVEWHRNRSQQLSRWKGARRPRRTLVVGRGVKRSPWHHSSPASPGTKPLCMAGQSLTSKAQFWDSPETGEAATQQKPPGSSPNSGIHCVDRGWAAPKDLSLLARAYFCLRYP